MTESPILVPLHRYESPNGQGLCSYRFGIHTCGRGKGDLFHHVGSPAIPAQREPAEQERIDAVYQTYHGAALPVDDPPTTMQVVAMFHDQALRLAVNKDAAYAGAWLEQGYIGNVARILSKASRLRALVWGDLPPEDLEELLAGESVRDTLLDMANLCAFAAHNMTQGNRWGGSHG